MDGGRDIRAECLDRRVKNQPGDWWVFLTKSQLGAALAGQKKYLEAEPLLIDGYEGLKDRAGPKSHYL